MPLLNLDPENTIRNIVRDFKRETGLKLVIFDGKEPAVLSLTMYELHRKRHKYRYGRYFKTYLKDVFPESIMKFGSRCTIADIKAIFMEQAMIRVQIYTNDNKLVNSKIRLEVASSRKFRNRDYNWERINALNSRIETIRTEIITKVKSMIPILNNRVMDTSDWLMDYEIEVSLYYYLDRNDPLYYENSDNIIIEQKTNVYADNNRTIEWVDLGEGMIEEEMIDFNDWEPWDKTDRQNHCYLFHDLYDHHDLAREDVQRIGNISVVIRVVCQHDYPVTSFVITSGGSR